MSKKINLKIKKNKKRKINREKREYQLFRKQKYESTFDYAIELLLKEVE